jgi:hypothetical protein
MTKTQGPSHSKGSEPVRFSGSLLDGHEVHQSSAVIPCKLSETSSLGIASSSSHHNIGCWQTHRFSKSTTRVEYSRELNLHTKCVSKHHIFQADHYFSASS